MLFIAKAFSITVTYYVRLLSSWSKKPPKILRRINLIAVADKLFHGRS
jgi:hypothetical protein